MDQKLIFSFLFRVWNPGIYFVEFLISIAFPKLIVLGVSYLAFHPLPGNIMACLAKKSFQLNFARFFRIESSKKILVNLAHIWQDLNAVFVHTDDSRSPVPHRNVIGEQLYGLHDPMMVFVLPKKPYLFLVLKTHCCLKFFSLLLIMMEAGHWWVVTLNLEAKSVDILDSISRRGQSRNDVLQRTIIKLLSFLFFL